MSQLAGSDAKNTDATTDFSSSSMPALAAACFTIACVFWRTALIEVWYTIFSFLPSFVRTPSDPFFQPAASRIWFALSDVQLPLVVLGG